MGSDLAVHRDLTLVHFRDDVRKDRLVTLEEQMAAQIL